MALRRYPATAPAVPFLAELAIAPETPNRHHLYTVVLTRLRTDPATRAYATRRRAQGKTNREIKRCLIR
jgi:hypothetical protein